MIVLIGAIYLVIGWALAELGEWQARRQGGPVGSLAVSLIILFLWPILVTQAVVRRLRTGRWY